MSQETNAQGAAEVAQGPKQITVSAVIEQLDLGKDRKEIAAYFGVSQEAMKRDVWSHPALKGKKRRAAVGSVVQLIDDTVDAGADTAATQEAPATETDTANDQANDGQATEGNQWGTN